RALAVEAGQAILDVDGVVDTPLLAVVDDRQRGRRLLVHRVEHRGPHARVEGGRGLGPTLLAILQHGHEITRPRETAGVGGEDPVGAAPHTWRSLGSRRSRTQSPRMVRDRTVTRGAMPGKINTHHACSMSPRPSATMTPHDGVGGGMPTPR